VEEGGGIFELLRVGWEGGGVGVQGGGGEFEEIG
jgi:hypothetical protein